MCSAFYNRNISTNEMQQNYDAWLPNSRPFAIAGTSTVYENVLTNFTLSASDFGIMHTPNLMRSSHKRVRTAISCVSIV